MATGIYMDERSVDCLVLGHHGHDRKVSAKSVTMRAMTQCKNLSGYRELLLNFIIDVIVKHRFLCRQTHSHWAQTRARFGRPNRILSCTL